MPRIAFVVLFSILAVGVTPPPSVGASSDPPVHAQVASTVRELSESSPTRRQLAGATDEELVDLLIRCADLAGETYCTNFGFTAQDTSAPEFHDNLVSLMNSRASGAGDMPFGVWLEHLAAMPSAERIALETDALEQAAHDATEMLDAPRLRAMRTTAGTSRTLYNDSGARKQVASNWCGPATMQMIDGNDPTDSNGFDSQASWADDLGTGDPGGIGTSIHALVNEVNADTQYGMGVWSLVGRDKGWMWDRVTFQMGEHNEPWIQHPKLLDQFHPYLAGDHGGHFQVGRGWEHKEGGGKAVKLFEPYNEPDFNSAYTVNTWGPRRISLENAWDANLANTDHKNIGS